MSDEIRKQLTDDEVPRAGESFLSRFHRRKMEARLATNQADSAIESPPSQMEVVAPDGAEDTEKILTDADMPALESLSADSDYTGFLSPKVSESLRRAALRKLFHTAEFNIVDGLDEYAEDFTTFEPLGDIVTSDMRHLIEVEAKKKAEAIKKALLEDDNEADYPANEIGEEDPEIAAKDTQDAGEEVSLNPPPDH